jgi:thiamine-monophosphate kinase
MELPQPRVALGLALRGVATSAIDLSDGLVGDLGHVIAASGVAARVEADALPRSAALARQPVELQQECLLAGGDDYELLFTAPPGREGAVRAAAATAAIEVTRIGRIEPGAGLVVAGSDGAPLAAGLRGFDHFA